jgi:hypothetical protein
MRRLHQVSTVDYTKRIDVACFQALVKYGKIFWGNSSNLTQILLLQKTVHRIMLGLTSKSSCRTWFKKRNILTVPCLYIFLLAMFLINNFSYFQTNLSVHCINTWPKNVLQRLLISLLSIQKDITYSAIMLFNKLPLWIKQLQCAKVQFENALNWCLLAHSFYSFEDFLSQ